MKKTLSAILMTTALAGLAGCAQPKFRHEPYHYTGRIDDRYITFVEFESNSGSNFLRVTDKEGMDVTYRDGTSDCADYVIGDLKIDSIFIKASPRAEAMNDAFFCASSKDPAVQAIIQKGQMQYDSYLQKILEIKSEPIMKQ